MDMEFFYTALKLSWEMEGKLPFGRLNGRKPKDIAPLIYKIPRSTRWNVKQAPNNEGWISKINMNADISVDNIHQYVTL
jgi:hypothetical protein